MDYCTKLFALANFFLTDFINLSNVRINYDSFMYKNKEIFNRIKYFIRFRKLILTWKEVNLHLI